MPERPIAPTLRPFEAVGGFTIGVVDSLGRFGTFFGEALGAAVTPPFKVRAFIDRIDYIGYRSLQIYLTLVRFGSEAFLGPAVALSLIRELGPVLAALMVTGRAGSALTAEIGIMRITEQIDALTVMALSPMRYLVAPSILAGLVTFPLMTALFGVIVTWVCTYKGFHVSRGAEGVAAATTQAVVLSSVLILVWDYFLGTVLP